MEELHTDSIDGGHEASYGLGHVPGRGRTPTKLNEYTPNHEIPGCLFESYYQLNKY
jgi:hypothetical protein